jgi:hypothetical protein
MPAVSTPLFDLSPVVHLQPGSTQSAAITSGVRTSSAGESERAV